VAVVGSDGEPGYGCVFVLCEYNADSGYDEVFGFAGFGFDGAVCVVVDVLVDSGLVCVVAGDAAGVRELGVVVPGGVPVEGGPEYVFVHVGDVIGIVGVIECADDIDDGPILLVCDVE